MPARKLSEKIKKLKGTYQPSRDRAKKTAPVSVETLGTAPGHMTDLEKETWTEISAKLPPRTATEADSLAFEVLVRLMGKFRTEGLTGTETTLLMRSFSKFGLTPQDRGTIEPVPEPKGPNPFDKFKPKAN